MSQTDPNAGQNPSETTGAAGEPETSTDAGAPADLELPAAPPSPEAPPAAGAAPAAPTGPRVFPQHFKLLLGTTAVALGCMGVWERPEVTGRVLHGTDSISGSFIFLFAVYSFVVSVLNILQGRLRVGSAAITGLLGLYFGIRELVRIIGLEGFQHFGDIRKRPGLAIQDAIEVFLGQIGPGLYLVLFGGLVIIWIFFKALTTKGPSAPAAPPPRRARR